MKHTLELKSLFAVILCFLMSSVSYGATIHQSNVRTAQHQLAPGAQVAIIPPRGSKVSSSFVGFQVGSTATIKITEQRGPFNQNIGSYTKDYWIQKGYTYKQSSNVVLNGQPAMLFELNRPDETGKELGVWLFVLGDTRRTILIEGAFPKGGPESQPIRRALLSAYLQVDQVGNRTPGFSVNVAGTPFQFAESVAGVRYYTPDAKPVPDPITNAFFSITKRNGPVAPEQQQEFLKKHASARLGEDGMADATLKPIVRAGLKGYELEANIDGARVRKRVQGSTRTRSLRGAYYLVALFAGDGIYIMEGVAAREATNNVGYFKRIASTFTLK